MKKWVALLAMLLFFILLGSVALADQDMTVQVNGEEPADTVEIDISRVQTAQLTASEPVTWSCTSSWRCSIDENGLLSVRNPGGFNVTARAEDRTRRTIRFKAVRGILGISITGQSTMTTRQTVRLRAEITPSNATNRRLTWTSSNPDIVTVNAYGRVKAMPVTEVSKVTITAAAQDGSGVVGEFEITVYPVATAVTLLLDGEPVNGKTLTIDLATFNTLRFSAQVTPAAASQDVTWKTSSRYTAPVNNGLVEALRKGRVTLTATTNDGTRLRATCKIEISIISKQVEITGPNVVTAGKSIRLKADVQPSNTVNKRVTWSSSDPSVATVNSSGVVRACQVDARRTVTITATAKDGGASANYVVTVVPKAGFVVIMRDGAPATGTLLMNSAAVGSKLTVSAAVYPADAAQGVKWSTSNSRVATVEQDGTIVCRSRGKALITATAQDGSHARCNVYLVVDDFGAMPYYIEVDKANQVVRVYERGDGSYTHLVRRMICSTGTWNTNFSNNLYSLNGSRMVWCLAGDRQHYMQYATRIHGPYMFHSVPTHKRSADTTVVDYYNRLGTKASGGCVRLLCADAKWIYENVPAGTYVLVTEGTRNAAEYGAVSAPPIRGTWDPTDDNPDNPYYDPTYSSEIK